MCDCVPLTTSVGSLFYFQMRGCLNRWALSALTYKRMRPSLLQCYPSVLSGFKVYNFLRLMKQSYAYLSLFSLIVPHSWASRVFTHPILQLKPEKWLFLPIFSEAIAMRSQPHETVQLRPRGQSKSRPIKAKSTGSEGVVCSMRFHSRTIFGHIALGEHANSFVAWLSSSHSTPPCGMSTRLYFSSSSSHSCVYQQYNILLFL